MNPPNQSQERRMGQGMIWLAAIAALVVLTLGFQSLDRPDGGMTSTLDGAGRAMIVLERDRSGHYLAEGAINGQPVLFLVDTGATDVAVSERAARALGLDFGPRVRVQTAAGPAPAWMTRLDRVTVGGLDLADVRATITPGLGEQALLGMSFLRNFSIRQDGEQLIIAHPETDA
jgi:aspartyl protease family protein